MVLKQNSENISGLEVYTKLNEEFKDNNKAFSESMKDLKKGDYPVYRERKVPLEASAFKKRADEVNMIDGQFEKKVYKFMEHAKIDVGIESAAYLCKLIKLAYMHKDTYEQSRSFYVVLNDKNHPFYDILNDEFIIKPRLDYVEYLQLSKDYAPGAIDAAYKKYEKIFGKLNRDYIFYAIDLLLSDLNVNIGLFVNLAVESNFDINVANHIEEYHHEYEMVTPKI